MRIIIDTNGNKYIKIESTDFNSGRGFSIQTNGNLPFIHKNFDKFTKFDKIDQFELFMLESEIMNYVDEYGTPKQQMKVLGYIPKKD